MHTTALDYAQLAVRHGFAYLGPIKVTASRSVLFPKPPRGGGLYCIIFHSGGAYIGETGLYGRQGDKVGRFDHYTNPADDIWTELVVHEMLVVGGGGDAYVLPKEGDKRIRLDLEANLIAAFVKAGARLWNRTPTRLERDYLAWLLPIARRMFAAASVRYVPRASLTPYSQRRLVKLTKLVAELEERAFKLGLPIVVENGEFSETWRAPSKPLPALVEQKFMVDTMPKYYRTDTITAKVHRYLAERPDATSEQLRYDMSGINPSTLDTLWRDHQMTLEALYGADYKPGERLTLTIRRIVCRLFRPSQDVSARAVEQELRGQGVDAKWSTISSITANTVSSLRALAAASDMLSKTGK